MRRLLGIAFAASVFLAAAFAFSPRAIPTFPATGLRVDTVLLLDGARVGARIVAVGERGRILVSDDDGASWRAASSPTEATLTAVHFTDAAHGWAVGHDATILHTDDAGATWRVVHSAPGEERPLLDVWFHNPDRGIAIGAYGAYLETSDGGRNWTSRSIIDGDRHLNAIAADARGRLFIAGESGLLLASADGGRRWERLAAPYPGSYFGILAPGDENLLAYGLRGNVFRSPDFGQSWRRVDGPGEASLMGGLAIVPQTVVLVGQDAAVLVSRNGGATFAARRAAGGVAFSAVLRAADADVLAFGERGVTRIQGALAP